MKVPEQYTKRKIDYSDTKEIGFQNPSDPNKVFIINDEQILEDLKEIEKG